MTSSAILSTAAALVFQNYKVQNFLAMPRKAYVEGYFVFTPELQSDVIISLDQEMFDGNYSPVHGIPGLDSMAFAGVRRDGYVFLAVGNESTHAGHPSAQREWLGLVAGNVPTIGRSLAANTWHKMRIEADFKKREWIKVQVTTLDGPTSVLPFAGHKLDYPNHMPTVGGPGNRGRSMLYCCGAMRNSDWMGGNPVGDPNVYWDYVTAGYIDFRGRDVPLFADQFEDQQTIDPQPPVTNPIDLDNYIDGRWYAERAEAVGHLTIADFGGDHVMRANVDLPLP